jgi:hypothetical protein
MVVDDPSYFRPAGLSSLQRPTVAAAPCQRPESTLSDIVLQVPRR